MGWGWLPFLQNGSTDVCRLLILCFILYLPGGLSGQKGFLGCVRALKINGVMYDLEERAKVTSGVNPGCQGHCNSYGMHCRNGGKCVEQYNGYSCDCTLTAYDGPFCTDGKSQLSVNSCEHCVKPVIDQWLSQCISTRPNTTKHKLV